MTVLILATAAVAIILTAGRSAPPTLASYVAADDVAGYFEARLDLPGDQGEKLGAFLGRFPGFDDQSLDSRLDDLMNEFVAKATQNEQDWTTDIEPWFEGAVGMVISGDMMTAGIEQSGSKPPSGLFLLSIKDAPKAEAWLSALAGKSDVSATDYKGTAVYYGGSSSPDRLAVGILGGRVMLAGDEASVHEAIDLGGKGSLGDTEQFKAARAAFTGDSLGFMYLNLESYVSAIPELGDASMASPCISTAGYLEMIPDWMMVRFVARENGLAFETAFPHIEGAAQAENRVSRIAPHLPGSTIALFEVHDVGAAILSFIDQCREDPDFAAALAELEPQLRIIGGLDGMLGWMGDLGVVLTRDGDKVDGGLVVATDNRADAERLLGFFSSAIQLGGSSMGFDVRDEEYAGTTITTIDLGDWQDLAALAGSAGSIPFEGRFEIAYAATDEFVVMGAGDAFVKAALDAAPGTSLADNARFKSLIESVGSDGAGTVFVDITAVRELMEDLVTSFDPSALAEYERDIKPWLEPFDAYIASGRRDGDLDRSTGIVTVK